MNSQNYLIPVKILGIIASCIGTHISWSPPSHATKTERPPPADTLERVLNAIIPHAWVVRTIWWALGMAEILTIALHFATPSSKFPYATGSAAALEVNKSFLISVTLVVLGSGLRYACYRIMSTNFTFVISIRSKHNLVTGGPYSVVRHPSYTGYIMVHSGLALRYATQGSWLRESGILHIFVCKMILGSFAIYHIAVGYFLLRRMAAEDRLLKQAFGKKWENYAKNVPYAIVPGIL